MSDAGTKIRDFKSDLNTWQEAWHTFAIRPYSTAFTTAQDAIKDTLKSEEELRKRRLELGLLALSICSGGVLAAVFGQTALKNVAADAAITTICNRNLERAFRAAHWIESNKAATFVLGTVWDEAGTMIGTAIKDSLQENVTKFPALNSFKANPLNVKTALEQFVGEVRLKLDMVAGWLRDNPQMGDEDKLTILEKLKKAPFCSPPRQISIDGNLHDRIELSFYMSLVLDADSLRMQNVQGDRSTQIPAVSSQSVKIARMPSSEHYPRGSSSTTVLESRGMFSSDTVLSSRTTVEYDNIGSRIAKRIEHLYQSCGFGDRFFSAGGELWGDQRTNRAILLRAEQALDSMARMGTHPISALR